MLDLMDVLKMMAAGRSLPQTGHTAPSKETIEALQEAEPELLNHLFLSLDRGEDPADVLLRELGKLAKRHGWFNTASILCMIFARRYQPEHVPDLGSDEVGTMNLLKMLPISVAQEEGGDEAAWTVPMAILADLGEGNALKFTACAGFCAGVGHMQESLKGQAAKS